MQGVLNLFLAQRPRKTLKHVTCASADVCKDLSTTQDLSKRSLQIRKENVVAFRHSKIWYVVHVLLGKCADEHVCSPRGFASIAIEPSRNRHLVSASGYKLKHDGERSVPMKLRDGRKIWIAFQACEVKGTIMSVGKCCTSKGTTDARRSRHEGHDGAGNVEVDRFRNHYELESWIKTRVVFTPVSVVGSSGSASDPVRHLAAAPQRSDTHQELTKNTMNPKSFW